MMVSFWAPFFGRRPKKGPKSGPPEGEVTTPLGGSFHHQVCDFWVLTCMIWDHIGQAAIRPKSYTNFSVKIGLFGGKNPQKNQFQH